MQTSNFRQAFLKREIYYFYFLQGLRWASISSGTEARSWNTQRSPEVTRPYTPSTTGYKDQFAQFRERWEKVSCHSHFISIAKYKSWCLALKHLMVHDEARLYANLSFGIWKDQILPNRTSSRFRPLFNIAWISSLCIITRNFTKISLLH